VFEKLRSGDPLTAKEKQIHDQGLVTVLRQIHDDPGIPHWHRIRLPPIPNPQFQRHIAEDLVTFLIQKYELLPAPSTVSCNPDPVAIRSAMGLSQTKFAQLIGGSVRTLHKWEQHTSSPSGAAKTLLKIAAIKPHFVREALRSA
jgi:putative transcriptional regulator